MTSENKTDSPASNVPDWLQADLFLDVLKKTVKGFKEIKKFSTVCGSEVGENYATIMLRVNIQVQLEGRPRTCDYILETDIIRHLQTARIKLYPTCLSCPISWKSSKR